LGLCQSDSGRTSCDCTRSNTLSLSISCANGSKN